jgi:hypothetical protein
MIVYIFKCQIIAVDAHGSGNLLDKLKSTKETHPASKIILFVDIDGQGKRRIEKICEDLKQKKLFSYLKQHDIFFVNPIIEYLYLVSKTNSHPGLLNKDEYKPIIRKWFNIDEYRCTSEQISKMIAELIEDKFEVLLDNLPNISQDIEHLPSSSIKKLIDYLK